MLDPLTWVGLVLLALALGLGLGYLLAGWRQSDDRTPFEEELLDAAAADEPVDLPQPDIKGSWMPFTGYLNVRRYLQKRKKLLNSGYVEWYLVEDGWPKPRFVKPKRQGGGVPEYKHKGKTYLFPRKGGIPNEQQGILTFVHNESDAQPVDVREPDRPTLAPDFVTEMFDRRVTSDSPGLLDRLDFNLTPEKMIGGAIAVTIVVSVLYGMV